MTGLTKATAGAEPPSRLLWLSLWALTLASCHLFTAEVEPEPIAEPTLDELLARCTYDDGQIPDSPSCHRAGQLLIEGSRQEEAIRPLRYACTDVPDACIELGLLHLRGEGVSRNPREAAKAFGSAGSLNGEASAWRVLLRMQSTPENALARDSRDFASHSACTYATTGWPCYNYGVLLACGYFGDVDLPHALSAFHRGCFLADPRACDLAGKLQTGTTRLPCDLVGPDPKNPVELTLHLEPPDNSETWPEGEERFKRTPLPIDL